MADQLAAAAMMAGHPNDASLLGLRDLPFAIFMGGDDAAFNRNKVATEKIAELDRLEAADPGAYVHMSRIYEGLGHWMNRKDAEALPWMQKFERDPWPTKIVWMQGNVVHDRFYWLKLVSATDMAKDQKIVASVAGQTITLEGDVPSQIQLRLSDRLINLDQPITVKLNGREAFAGKVYRDAEAIVESLRERADAPAAATAVVTVK